MTDTPQVSRTPLFTAQHSERYARQRLIQRYQVLTGANLIVMIDQIFPDNMTYMEELVDPLDPSEPLHLLLASPGGDGETAIRIVRSLQARCTELTVVLPDMAKSAATILSLGADHLVFGPGGDLGSVDPQMRCPNGTLASAKELVEAVDEAERRITANPDLQPRADREGQEPTAPLAHVGGDLLHRHAYLLGHGERVRLAGRGLVLLGHGGPCLLGRLWRTTNTYRKAGAKAGDRHLKFHEIRENLRGTTEPSRSAPANRSSPPPTPLPLELRDALALIN